MSTEINNLALWQSVEKTDPDYTKDFKKSGGFSGTAISPMWLMMRATETFGPIGIGWGFEEQEHLIAEGVWFSRVQLWYKHPSADRSYMEPAYIEQWGATAMVNERANGSRFVDEEAAKKAVTDAVTKCLSYIGFGADVHMGRFDDVKYVSELKQEKRKAAQSKQLQPELTPEQWQAEIKSFVKAQGIAPEDVRSLVTEFGYAKLADISDTGRLQTIYTTLARNAKQRSESNG